MARVTKKSVLADFRENILPMVRKQFEPDGRVDAIARREAWNNYTDALCKDRVITAHQYDTWSNPF